MSLSDKDILDGLNVTPQDKGGVLLQFPDHEGQPIMVAAKSAKGRDLIGALQAIRMEYDARKEIKETPKVSDSFTHEGGANRGSLADALLGPAESGDSGSAPVQKTVQEVEEASEQRAPGVSMYDQLLLRREKLLVELEQRRKLETELRAVDAALEVYKQDEHDQGRTESNAVLSTGEEAGTGRDGDSGLQSKDAESGTPVDGRSRSERGVPKGSAGSRTNRRRGKSSK